jgi:hypothetical protein
MRHLSLYVSRVVDPEECLTDKVILDRLRAACGASIRGATLERRLAGYRSLGGTAPLERLPGGTYRLNLEFHEAAPRARPVHDTDKV